jgi:hypothetical protein
MTIPALDRLGNGFSDLLDVLDSDDIARMEAVLADVRGALEEVRSHGTWRDTHEVTGRIREIMPLVEAARVRVNFLTDMTRERVDLLAVHSGSMDLTTYKP